MDRVDPTPLFVARFQEIVENPQKAIYNAFPEVSGYDLPRSQLQIVVTVVAGASAAVASVCHYKKTAFALGALAVLFFYAHKAIALQEKAKLNQKIDAFFNPYINCFSSETVNKGQYIYASLAADPPEEPITRQKIVDKVSSIANEYNDLRNFAGNSYDDIVHLKEILPLCQKLIQQEQKLPPDGVSLYALQKFKELRKTAIGLVYGHPEMVLGEKMPPYIYISKTSTDGKFTVEPWVCNKNYSNLGFMQPD